ncbi:Hypothetical predicted protein [Lecanosticta acicola]|uniref:Coiled-coil domain-containing protein 16 n=1 Tax=Lecanosticta acicola TaxID=111012 RepID=A0AAI8YWI5_9PEZI|nr:Hypothetical predicted protein [Lecanosticta acicola]
MTDVRSMLRAQREARKINHPHASYTSDGKLLCNLCETPVKDAAWQGHLHSTQHILRQTRVQEAAATRRENGVSKKRKASIIDSPSPEDRKKSKPSVSFAPGAEEDDSTDAEQVDVTASADPEAPVAKTPSEKDGQAEELVDPAEQEAFERELQEMEASLAADRAGQNGVTISAAPMTAEEVAAHAREERSAQRGKRDAEIEGEREDAARLLEDEFEEMEGLEERVKKLREKREALRNPDGEGVNGNSEAGPPAGNATGVNGDPAEDSDDEDSEEEFDDWNFGRR